MKRSRRGGASHIVPAWTAVAWLFAAAAAAAAGPSLDAPAFSLSPAELLQVARAAPAVADRPVTYLLFERRYDVDEQQRLTLTARQVRRIERDQTDPALNQVQAVWSPIQQRRPEIRARTVTAAGELRSFDVATLSEEGLPGADPAVHTDTRLLRGPLPAISAGSVVEIETVLVDDRPPFAPGRSLSIAMRGDPSLPHQRVIVTVPAAMPLRHTLQNLPGARVSERVRAGRRELVVDLRTAAAAGAAADGEAPLLRFATGAGWPAIARAYEDVAEPFIRPDEVRALLPPDLPGDRDARIGALLDLLHRDVRYTGVALGENRYVPQPPSVTLARGYGDCKDKSVLLASLLRAAGIEARLALMNAGGVDIDATLPGIDAVDHMLVYVPGERELWIDATAEGYGVGELPYAAKGRLALPFGAGVDVPRRTPSARSVDNLTDERIDYLLPDLGDMRVRRQVRIQTPLSTLLRAVPEAHANLDEEYRQALAADAIEKSRWDLATRRGPITWELELRGSGKGNTAYEEATATVAVGDMLTNLPDALRDTEVAADEPVPDAALRFEPHLHVKSVRIVPPVGFRPEGLPASAELKLGPATLSRRVSVDDQGVVVLDLRFDTGDRVFTQAEGQAFRSAHRELRASDEVAVRYRHEAKALLQGGDARAALHRHAELVASHPAAAIHDLRWSRALLELRLVADARRAAERSIRKAPDSSDGYVQLGYVLQHDPLGHFRYEGFDRDGAVRAFRAALKRAPDDRYAHQQLGELLRFSSAGVLLGEGADLAGAVAELRWLAERSPDDFDVRRRLYGAMFEAGQYEPLLEQATRRAVNDSDILSPGYALAVRVVRDGAAAAVAESGFAGGNYGKRFTTAMVAVTALASARFYDEARALVAAADIESLVQGTFPPPMLALLKARRLETLPPPRDGPTGVASRYLRGMLATRPDIATLESLFSESAHQSGAMRALIARELAIIRRMRRTVEGWSPVGAGAAADVAIGSLTFDVDGSDEGPTRVATRAIGQSGGVLYVVREADGWRIAASREQPQLIGLAALHALDRGNVEVARRWIDWARRDYRPPAERGPDAVMPRIAATAAGPDDVAALRLAAAFLLASGRLPVLTDVRLEGVRKVLRTDEQRYLLDLVQFAAARTQHDTATLARLAPRLAAVRPGSEEALRVQVEASTAAQRWSEVETLLRGWVAAHPDSFPGKQGLAVTLANQGRAEEALALLAADAAEVEAQAADDGRANELSNRLNNYAWQALCADRVDDAAIDAARRAQSLRPAFSVGHTLASLLAVRGRVADAHATLDAAMKGDPAAVMEDAAVAFVYALAAESLGARATALEAYRVAAADTSLDASSVGALARVRMQRLEAAARPRPSPVPED